MSIILRASTVYKPLPSVATDSLLSHAAHNTVVTSFNHNLPTLLSHIPLQQTTHRHSGVWVSKHGNGILFQIPFSYRVPIHRYTRIINLLPLAFVSCIYPCLVFLHSMHTSVVYSHNLLIRKAIVLETKASFKLSLPQHTPLIPTSHAHTHTHTYTHTYTHTHTHSHTLHILHSYVDKRMNMHYTVKSIYKDTPEKRTPL